MDSSDLLELLPLPAGVVRERVFERANAALEELLGFAPGGLLGVPFEEIVVPQDRARLLDRYARRMRGEPVPTHYEVRLQRRDGAERIAEIWLARHGDQVVVQLRDRTARAARQARVARLVELGVRIQGERTHARILGALLDGLEELGAASMIIEERGDAVVVTASRLPPRVTRAFEGETGMHVLGLSGMHTEVTRAAWRDGSTFVDDFPLATAEFLAPTGAAAIGRAVATEGRLLRGILVRVDEGGQPAFVVLIAAEWLVPADATAFALFGAQVSAALDAARAIHDLSQRNAALDALNRVAAAAAATTSLDGLFASVVPELGAALGCNALAVYLVDPGAEEATLAHHTGSLVEVPPALQRVPLASTQLGAVARTGRATVLRADEYPEPARRLTESAGVRVTASVPLVARSKVVGVMNVGFPDDRVVADRELDLMAAAGAHLAAAIEAQRLLADLRLSYQDLGHTQEQLVQRERLAAIGELAAVVAHEVRNPLGVIFNSVGALRRLVGGEASVDTVVRILEEEAVRLNHIVSDLLDFARPSLPQLQPEKLDAILDDAVRAAVEGAREVELVRDVAPGMPLVRMDARLVRQALLNVVLNAVQAMPSGGKLLVSASLEGRNARVRIRDTGHGIPAEVRARIFEPFFTTRARGTGLGLAVVKRIVEGHGGAVEVSTEVGRGTSFDVLLPIGATEPPSPEARGAAR